MPTLITADVAGKKLSPVDMLIELFDGDYVTDTIIFPLRNIQRGVDKIRDAESFTVPRFIEHYTSNPETATKFKHVIRMNALLGKADFNQKDFPTLASVLESPAYGEAARRLIQMFDAYAEYYEGLGRKCKSKADFVALEENIEQKRKAWHRMNHAEEWFKKDDEFAKNPEDEIGKTWSEGMRGAQIH